MEKDLTPHRVFTVHRQPGVEPVECWSRLKIGCNGKGKRRWFIAYVPTDRSDGFTASEYPLVNDAGNVVRFATPDAARDRMMAIFNQTDHLHHHPKSGIRFPR